MSSVVEACPAGSRRQRQARLVIQLLYECGLRTSELCELEVRDVDLERQEVEVRHGKRDRARRIPVPDGGVDGAAGVSCGKSRAAGALLRTAVKKRRLAVKDVCAVARATATAAGLTRTVTPKRLRHSFATHFMDRDVDVAVIASLMGHRSARETGVYLHLPDGAGSAAGGGSCKVGIPWPLFCFTSRLRRPRIGEALNPASPTAVNCLNLQ